MIVIPELVEKRTETRYKDFVWDNEDAKKSSVPLDKAAESMLADPCMTILYHDEDGKIEGLRGTAESLLVFKAWCYVDKKFFCVTATDNDDILLVVDAKLDGEEIRLYSARLIIDKNDANKEFFDWYKHQCTILKSSGREKPWNENEIRYLHICGIDEQMNPEGKSQVICMDELDEEQHHGYCVYKGKQCYILHWGTKEHCEKMFQLRQAAKKHHSETLLQDGEL